MSSIPELQALLEYEEARRAAIKAALGAKQDQERKVQRKGAEKKQLTEAEIRELRTAFDAFDTDKNGTIEPKELAKIAEQQLGQSLSEKELKDTMEVLDVDQDGKVSFDEFVTWWGSSKKLGGHKGMGLAMLKAKMSAQLAQDNALARLKTMSMPEEFESDMRTSQVDIAIGGASSFPAKLQVDLTMTPSNPAALKMEAESLIKDVNEVGAKFPKEGYFESERPGPAKEDGDSDEECDGKVSAVFTVAFRVNSKLGKEEVDKLVKEYNTARSEFIKELSEGMAEEMRQIPPACRTEIDGEQRVLLVGLLRNEGPVAAIQEAVTRMLLGKDPMGGDDDEGGPIDGEAAREMMEKILDTFSISFQNAIPPGQWLKSEGTVADLFQRARLIFQAKYDSAINRTAQRGVIQKFKDHLIGCSRPTNQLLSALMPGVITNTKVKLRFASPLEAVHRSVQTWASQHRANVEAGLESGEIESTEELKKGLAQGKLEKIWAEQVTSQLGWTGAEVRCRVRKAAKQVTGDGFGAKVYDALVQPFLDRLEDPAEVRAYGALFNVTLKIKGLDLVSVLVPPTKSKAATWSKEAKGALEKFQTRREQRQERFEQCMSETKMDELEDVEADGEAQVPTILVGGLKGVGKSSLLHMLATGRALQNAKPTASVKGTVLYRRRRRDLPQRYIALECPADSTPEDLAHSGYSKETPTIVVWVVDGSADFDAGSAANKEAAAKLVGVAEGDGGLVMVAVTKSDKCSDVDAQKYLDSIFPEGDRQGGVQYRACKVSAVDSEVAEGLVNAIREAEKDPDLFAGGGGGGGGETDSAPEGPLDADDDDDASDSSFGGVPTLGGAPTLGGSQLWVAPQL